FRITGMVEKPKPEVAPSNLYINGRYILQPEIFKILEHQQRGAGNEIQLTDAMLKLAEKQPFYGCRFNGRAYDCGARLGFLIANLTFALDRPDLTADLKAEMRALLKDSPAESAPPAAASVGAVPCRTRTMRRACCCPATR